MGKTYTCGTREGKSTLQNLLDYSAPCELDIIAHIYSTQHSQSQTIDIVNLWWTCYCLAIFSFETKWCCFWKKMAGNALFSPTKCLGINLVKKSSNGRSVFVGPSFSCEDGHLILSHRIARLVQVGPKRYQKLKAQQITKKLDLGWHVGWSLPSHCSTPALARPLSSRSTSCKKVIRGGQGSRFQWCVSAAGETTVRCMTIMRLIFLPGIDDWLTSELMGIVDSPSWRGGRFNLGG